MQTLVSLWWMRVGLGAPTFQLTPHTGCLPHPITLRGAGTRWQLSSFPKTLISDRLPGCTIWRRLSRWLPPSSQHTVVGKQSKVTGSFLSATIELLSRTFPDVFPKHLQFGVMKCGNCKAKSCWWVVLSSRQNKCYLFYSWHLNWTY